MSEHFTDAVDRRERQLRRLAERQGLALRKQRRAGCGQGRFALIDPNGNYYVAGVMNGSEHLMDLDDVELYLSE